jgi:hypothetical protein
MISDTIDVCFHCIYKIAFVTDLGKRKVGSLQLTTLLPKLVLTYSWDLSSPNICNEQLSRLGRDQQHEEGDREGFSLCLSGRDSIYRVLIRAAKGGHRNGESHIRSLALCYVDQAIDLGYRRYSYWGVHADVGLEDCPTTYPCH